MPAERGKASHRSGDIAEQLNRNVTPSAKPVGWDSRQPEMDLVVNPRDRTVDVNPESPNIPTGIVKRAA
jgi:hypothetical protein